MAPLVWAIIGLALIVSEFIVPEFVVFFFGLGALLNSLLVALIPAIAGSIPLQIVIWLGFSALSLFGLRRTFSRWLKGRRFEDEDTGEYIGKPAKVIEAITPDRPGRIRFGGTTWVAESYTETFRPGDRVEILARDGMKFIVTESIAGLPEPPDDGGETAEFPTQPPPGEGSSDEADGHGSQKDE